MARAKSKQQKDRQRKIDFFNQQRTAKSLINESCYNDALKHERVARTTTGEVMSALGKQFGAVIVGAVPEVEDGLILSNDYGHGIFNV